MGIGAVSRLRAIYKLAAPSCSSSTVMFSSARQFYPSIPSSLLLPATLQNRVILGPGPTAQLLCLLTGVAALALICAAQAALRAEV